MDKIKRKKYEFRNDIFFFAVIDWFKKPKEKVAKQLFFQ